MTLMAPPPHERKKKYTLTCTAEQCEILNIDGADFLRLLEKSRCMVRSMERLRAERERQNRQAEENASDIQQKLEKSERELADATAAKARQMCEINELKRLVEEKEPGVGNMALKSRIKIQKTFK